MGDYTIAGHEDDVPDYPAQNWARPRRVTRSIDEVAPAREPEDPWGEDQACSSCNGVGAHAPLCQVGVTETAEYLAAYSRIRTMQRALEGSYDPLKIAQEEAEKYTANFDLPWADHWTEVAREVEALLSSRGGLPPYDDSPPQTALEYLANASTQPEPQPPQTRSKRKVRTAPTLFRHEEMTDGRTDKRT